MAATSELFLDCSFYAKSRPPINQDLHRIPFFQLPHNTIIAHPIMNTLRPQIQAMQNTAETVRATAERSGLAVEVVENGIHTVEDSDEERFHTGGYVGTESQSDSGNHGDEVGNVIMGKVELGVSLSVV